MFFRGKIAGNFTFRSNRSSFICGNTSLKSKILSFDSFKNDKISFSPFPQVKFFSYSRSLLDFSNNFGLNWKIHKRLVSPLFLHKISLIENTPLISKTFFSSLPLGVQNPNSINVALNALHDNPGAKKKKRRVGRGPGSTKGKTAGRGMGGQNKRSGGGVRPGFESGHTQMYKRVRKYGFSNAKFKVEYERLNIGRLVQFIERRRVDPKKIITMKILYDAGVFTSIKQGVKILGLGAERLKIPLNIEASAFSAKAAKAITDNGGTCKRVYYTKLGLRYLLKPEKFDIPIKRARPPEYKKDKFDDWGQNDPEANQHISQQITQQAQS